MDTRAPISIAEWKGFQREVERLAAENARLRDERTTVCRRLGVTPLIDPEELNAHASNAFCALLREPRLLHERDALLAAARDITDGKVQHGLILPVTVAQLDALRAAIAACAPPASVCPKCDHRRQVATGMGAMTGHWRCQDCGAEIPCAPPASGEVKP
jgi:hypothetical protein